MAQNFFVLFAFLNYDFLNCLAKSSEVAECEGFRIKKW